MKNEECLKSHLYPRVAIKHRLRSIEENDLDPDEGNARKCDACTFPIFSTPYQTGQDEGGRRYFLHKCCAELPEVLTEHPLHARDPLHLHNKLREDYSGLICTYCEEQCRGFFYQCPNPACLFTLHVECATQVKIVHRSHRHQLTLRGTVENQTCHACRMTKSGYFYWCYLCNFYLHQDCASLPNMIRHKNHVVDGHQHPLALTYILPRSLFRLRLPDQQRFSCAEFLGGDEDDILKNIFQKLVEVPILGMYICTKCEYCVHIKCATSVASDYVPVSVRDITTGLPHFPMKDEHTSLISYLQEQGCINNSHVSNNSIEEEKKYLKENIHNHDLILYDDYEIETHSSSSSHESAAASHHHLCNACIDPISRPFYTCPQPECNDDFYLHRCCANLPLLFQHPAHEYDHDEPLELLSRLPRFQSMYSFRMWCHVGCGRYSNGFLYKCDACSYYMDVKCALLPIATTYEFHGKSHILFLFLSYGREDSLLDVPCDCCGRNIMRLYYECGTCPNFKIHARCILLPSSVSHKYDRHPLKLTLPMDYGKEDGKEEFCEVCEDGIDTTNYQWFYHCRECVASFHINCIPCVGMYAKIKFGKTIRVGCHECPLTCVRMLTSYSYSCGVCKKDIEGGVCEETIDAHDGEGIAFECIKCGFWLHYRCARDNSVDDDE